jgi:TetR/AcrR family fatty acid metabolism transcriptional regulator
MKDLDVRKKIISAAVKIFAQKGFFEATVEDIAHAAGVAKGTVYLYFKDKPSLYISVIDEQFITGFTFLDKLKKENLSCVEKLHKIVNNWLNYMFKFEHELPMYSIENINMTKKIMKGIQPMIYQHLDKTVRHISEIIRQGVNSGELRKVDPKISAVYFLNSIRTAFLLHVFYPQIKNPEKQIDDMLLFGLKRR